ncbi:MAG: hypothetical protein ACI8XB_001309 [Patiriisocius sp.]
MANIKKQSKNMKKTLSIILVLISTVSFSQTLKRDKDLRLTGDINHKIFNDEADNDYPKGLMDNFTLGIQWWEFLGEPMEYYSFKWEATQVIQIDFGTFLKRSDLDKYPDLLKRFDNIRPSHLELGLSASQDLNSSYRNIKYNLEDWQILYTKAGVQSKNLSPGSPETWNEFWKWDSDMQKNYNIETEKFKTLSEEEQKKITRELRTKFRQCTSLNVSVYIEDIKWPKSEINGIYEAYLQYEKGEKEPSPLEEVKEAEKEIAKETTYTKDDFWGEVADVGEPELELFDIVDESGRYLKNGLREKNSKKVLIEPVKALSNIGDLRKDFEEVRLYGRGAGANYGTVERTKERVRLDGNNDFFKYYIQQDTYGDSRTNTSSGGSIYNNKGELIIKRFDGWGFFIADNVNGYDSMKDWDYEKQSWSGQLDGYKMNKIAEQLMVYNKEIMIFEVARNTYDVYYVDNFELIKRGVQISN